MKRKKHTYESIFNDALPYKNRCAFQKGNNKAYNAAINMGVLDNVCSHMIPVQRTHTTESLTRCAEKYRTRSEFNNNDTSAYQIAKKRGLLNGNTEIFTCNVLNL